LKINTQHSTMQENNCQQANFRKQKKEMYQQRTHRGI